jgi:hypothetical protein
MWVDETGPHPGRLLITSGEGPLLLSSTARLNAGAANRNTPTETWGTSQIRETEPGDLLSYRRIREALEQRRI